jgi:acetyl-CoA carboxylase, biotin carboxylase subunit
MFKKILIANRGEIAVRIERACRELGIVSVGVYSEADRASLHVRLADEAYPIGPSPSRESYLVIEKMMGVARYSGCDAIHPGYGFLAENPAFARECRKAAITFIGPTAEAMETLGEKTAARKIARAAGVPTVPGTLDPIATVKEAISTAQGIGYPVILKAVAGGGGKGMRLIEREEELASGWRDASSEAQNAFGDGRMYLEKYLARPRHVEIQILSDHHGKILFLGERECSVQRRHQKVIEEAPSPILTAELRRSMGEAAVRLAHRGGYTNAGTVEFLVDEARHFYFLEMNTRLQVEHPVTEMVTSLDLVQLQIRIAAGEAIPFHQEDVVLRGHSIECRIYAEDPENNFFPAPGKIEEYRPPGGLGIRMDDGVYGGWNVPTEYDPMLGKLIAWGSDRAEAIARLRRALEEFSASGIQTNIALFRRILAAKKFVEGAIDTQWLDDFLNEPSVGKVRALLQNGTTSKNHAEEAALIAVALWHQSGNGTAGSITRNSCGSAFRWKSAAREEAASWFPRR